MSFFHSRESTYIPYFEKETVGVRVKCSYPKIKGSYETVGKKDAKHYHRGSLLGMKLNGNVGKENGSLDSKFCQGLVL